jgi:hypothetical protein
MVYAAAVVVLAMSGPDAANGLLPGAALVPRQTRRRWRTQLPARIAGRW